MRITICFCELLIIVVHLRCYRYLFDNLNSCQCHTLIVVIEWMMSSRSLMILIHLGSFLNRQ